MAPQKRQEQPLKKSKVGAVPAVGDLAPVVTQQIQLNILDALTAQLKKMTDTKALTQLNLSPIGLT
jgi:hypothetical protein